MPVEGISGIQSVSNPTGIQKTTEKSSEFSNLLSQAIENIEETEAASQQSTVELLTGQDESVHNAMINAEKAELALSLAIQIRNKVLDAYKEIMQMQI